MKSFGVRLFGGVLGATIQTPFIAAGSALVGYTYAKLTDLSPNRVSTALVIWNVAESALLALTSNLIQDHFLQNLTKAILLTITTTIGIQEFRNRGFIGNKMTLCIVGARILFFVRGSFLSPVTTQTEEIVD